MKILFNIIFTGNNRFNAQILNAIEIARRLSKKLNYSFSLFNTTLEKVDCIESIYLPPGILGKIKKVKELLFGKCRIVIYYRDNKADKIFVGLKKILGRILIPSIEIDYLPDSPSNKKIIENSLKHGDYIIAISKKIKNTLPKYNKEDNIFIAHVGFEDNIFYPQKDYSKREYITYIGTLQNRKQPKVFIELSEYLKEEKFILIGNGSLEIEIDNLIKSKKHQNLTWYKQKTRFELAKILNNSKLFVFPSLHEGTPKVLYESAGCAVPILILDKIYSPVVVDNHSGFICKKKKELFEKAKLLCDNYILAKSFSENIYKLSTKYSWDNVVLEWENVFLRIERDLKHNNII